MLAARECKSTRPPSLPASLHCRCAPPPCRRGLLGGTSPSVVANVTSKVGSVEDNRSGGGYAYRSSKAALNS